MKTFECEILYFLTFIAAAWSSCNIDQRAHCLDLYRKSLTFWSKVGEMNECAPKPYSEFTHICSVSNYLPSIDHCCCVTKDEHTSGDDDDDDDISDDTRERTKRHVNNDVVSNNRPIISGNNGLSVYGEVRHVEGGKHDALKRRKRNADSLLMCCRYHQDWNRFRCQESLDTLDTKFAENSVFQSNFESLTSSLLCYGFFVIVIVAFITIIICFVRMRKIRKYKARKNNNSRANDIAAPLFEPFDETPPPYSQGSYCAPPYEGSLHHPLILADCTRIEPTAPMEDGRLLSNAVEYFYEDRSAEERLNSDTTVVTTLGSFSDEAPPACLGDQSEDLIRCEDSGTSGGDYESGGRRDDVTVQSRRRQLDCRPIVEPIINTHQIDISIGPDSSSSSPSDVFHRLSPPPTYEESLREG